MSLRERVASLLVVGFRGLEISADDPIARAIRDDGLGGVILFDRDQQTGEPRNIASPDQLRDLTAALREAAGRPLWIAIDQEGGRVARLGPQNGFAATPSQAEIGATGDPAEARNIARATASTLRSMGIALNLAPVVDLNVNPQNPSIGALGRSFSADPDVVVDLADAVIRGHHDEGVLTCLKHFPGLGSATGDTDRGFVDVSATWTPRELEPFARLVASVADMVMVANALNRNVDPDLPSTLSQATVGRLRSDLGWDGVVITDDLQAGALTSAYGDDEIVRLALGAGNDILLFANQQVYAPDVAARTTDTVVRLVEAGQIDEGLIDASVARVHALRGRG